MKSKLVLCAILLGSVATTVSAAPISGTLFFTGDLRVGTNPGPPPANTIDFKTSAGGTNVVSPSLAVTTTGDINVEPSSTGNFAAYVQPADPDDGNIRDLSSAFAPIGMTINVPNFLTFEAAPQVIFDLTFIEPGTFAGTPFSIIQSGTSVLVNFNVRGNVRDLTDPAAGNLVSTFTGSFAQVFDNATVASIVNQFVTQGFFDASYTANFNVTPIPEPGTITLLGTAVTLLGISSYFRKKV